MILGRGLTALIALAAPFATFCESFPVHLNGTNPDAAAAAQAGHVQAVNASWWGFDSEDSTPFLQAALDSGAKQVLIPYVGEPWIIRPLTMRSNQEISFEPGVLVLAKKGEFLGKGDSLFRAANEQNITVTGYGATLRMHKRDYQQPPYERAEWRMGLSFNGCQNVQVAGLRIESTGGDGIYIGNCKDVVIRDVICFDNHRQGCSVVGVENLLIENSVFANTWGTAPGAGIDLEPDGPKERLSNIVVRDCIFEDNEGHQILVYAKNLREESGPISVRFENCLVRQTTFDYVARGMGRNDATHGHAGICAAAVGDEGPQGYIEFVNCTVENTGRESAKVFDKAPGKAEVRFINCKFKDSWQAPHPDYADVRPPIYLQVRRPQVAGSLGGVAFIDCHVYDTVYRPAIQLAPINSERGVTGLSGRIFTHGPHEPQMWLGPAAENISLQLVRAEAAAPRERTPGADAE